MLRPDSGLADDSPALTKSALTAKLQGLHLQRVVSAAYRTWHLARKSQYWLRLWSHRSVSHGLTVSTGKVA